MEDTTNEIKCPFCDERLRRNLVLQKKMEFFQKQEGRTFILLFNGRIYNGFIEKISPDSVILDDRNSGKILIFYEEIKVVEPRKEREGVN
jgi:hypothetical protein